MANNSTFKRGGFGWAGGCYICLGCGRKTRETGWGESDLSLCAFCFIESGNENEHLDGMHAEKHDDCHLCNPVGWAKALCGNNGVQPRAGLKPSDLGQ